VKSDRRGMVRPEVVAEGGGGVADRWAVRARQAPRMAAIRTAGSPRAVAPTAAGLRQRRGAEAPSIGTAGADAGPWNAYAL